MNAIAQVIAAVNANNGVVADDHRGAADRVIFGMATLVRGEQEVAVPLIDARYFSINGLYIGTDGKAHISTSSVGGVVEKFALTMDTAILNYNEGQSENMFCNSFLVDVHYLVDGKLEPVDLVTRDQVKELQAKAKAARDKWEKEFEAKAQA
jgi:hypothetical protein